MRPSPARPLARLASTIGPAVVLALLCLLPASRASAQVRCDPAVPRNDAQSSGYRPRGDRCEGIYKRQVSSFGVQLVSLTARSEPGDMCTAGAPVQMIWPAPSAGLVAAGPIHLQAES